MWLCHLKSIILLTLTESILEVVQAQPTGKSGERTDGEPDKGISEELETLKSTFRSLKGQKERSDEGEDIPPVPEPKDCGEWCKIPIEYRSRHSRESEMEEEGGQWPKEWQLKTKKCTPKAGKCNYTLPFDDKNLPCCPEYPICNRGLCNWQPGCRSLGDECAPKLAHGKCCPSFVCYEGKCTDKPPNPHETFFSKDKKLFDPRKKMTKMEE